MGWKCRFTLEVHPRTQFDNMTDDEKLEGVKNAKNLDHIYKNSFNKR